MTTHAQPVGRPVRTVHPHQVNLSVAGHWRSISCAGGSNPHSFRESGASATNAKAFNAPGRTASFGPRKSARCSMGAHLPAFGARFVTSMVRPSPLHDPLGFIGIYNADSPENEITRAENSQSLTSSRRIRRHQVSGVYTNSQMSGSGPRLRRQ